MPNVLVDDFPDAVEIDGEIYAINTDFQSCLLCILAFEDETLTPYEQAAILLHNLYPEQPPNLQAAIDEGIRFLNRGDDDDNDGKPITHKARVYSFEKDADLIFAAFRQTHGVDLKTADLHWWAFIALFMDLGSETTFCSLVSLRKRVLDGTATKDEQKLYLKLKDWAAIKQPDRRTPEQKAKSADFWSKAKEGQRRQREQKAKRTDAGS